MYIQQSLKELMLAATTMSDGKEFRSFITFAAKPYFSLCICFHMNCSPFDLVQQVLY